MLYIVFFFFKTGIAGPCGRPRDVCYLMKDHASNRIVQFSAERYSYVNAVQFSTLQSSALQKSSVKHSTVQ